MPMTVETPRVPRVKEYETPVFRAPEGPKLRSIEAMTQGSAAGVALGQKISALGTDLMDTIVKKQKEIQYGEGITLGSKKVVEYGAKLEDLEKEYAPKLTGDNSQQISMEFDQKKKEIQKEYEDVLSTNLVARQYFDRHVPSIAETHRRSFGATVEGVSTNTAISTLETQAAQSSSRVNIHNMFEEHDKIKVDIMQNTAIPANKRQIVADKVGQVYIDTAYKRLLQDEKSGMSVAMTIPEFKKKLEDRAALGTMDNYMALLETVKNKETLTNADTILKNNPENRNPDGSYNYTKMLSDLTKPEMYKKLGLTAEQAAHQKNIYNAEENEIKSKKIETDKIIKKEYENTMVSEYGKKNYSKIFQMANEKDNPLTPDERRGWIDIVTRIPKEQARMDRMEARAERAERKEEIAELKRASAAEMLMRIYSEDESKNPKNELEIITALAPVDPVLADKMVTEYQQNKNKKDAPFQAALTSINNHKTAGLFSSNKEKNLNLAYKAVLKLNELKGHKGVNYEVEVEKIFKESKTSFTQDILENMYMGRFTKPTNREDILFPDKVFVKGQTSVTQKERTIVESWTGKKTGKKVVKYSDGTTEYAN